MFNNVYNLKLNIFFYQGPAAKELRKDLKKLVR